MSSDSSFPRQCTSSSSSSSSSSSTSDLFDHTTLLSLAICETEARRSPEIVDLFEQAETDHLALFEYGIDSWISITHILQQQIVLRGLKFIEQQSPSLPQTTICATTSSLTPSMTSFSASPVELREAILEAIGFTKPLSATTPRKALKAEDIVGGNDRLERGLSELRLGGKKYSDTIGQVSIYWKFNRANEGHLRESDLAPDVPLHLLDGSNTTLHALVRKSFPFPLVIVGGSYS